MLARLLTNFHSETAWPLLHSEITKTKIRNSKKLHSDEGGGGVVGSGGGDRHAAVHGFVDGDRRRRTLATSARWRRPVAASALGGWESRAPFVVLAASASSHFRHLRDECDPTVMHHNHSQKVLLVGLLPLLHSNSRLRTGKSLNWSDSAPRLYQIWKC